MQSNVITTLRLFGLTAVVSILAALYLLAPPCASAATVTWIGATNTDWHTGSNWSTGLEPGASDNVIVNNVANAPTLSNARTIHSLTINGGETVTLNNTLTMDGTPTTATLINNGTITGSGTLETQNTVSFSTVGAFDVALNANTGTTTSATGTYGGNIIIDSGATLTVNASSTLTHNGDLTNNGTLSGASNASFIFNGTNKTVTNNGSITPGFFIFDQAGAKNLTGTGAWTGTNLRINNGATVTLTSDVTVSATNFVVAATGGGTLDLGGFNLTLSGVNFTSNATSTVSNGTLSTQGTNTIVVNDLAAFIPAVVVNTGTTNVNTSTFDAGSSITVDSGATLNLPGSQTLTHSGDLTNSGTLAGASNATFISNGTNKTVTNNGSITPGFFTFDQVGAKNLAGTGTWTGTNLRINNGATVTLTSNVTIGATNFTIGQTGSATLALGGFVLTLNGVNFTNGASGTVTGTGTFLTQGTTTIAISGLTFGGALEVNSGTTNANSSTIAGSITINAGATLNLPGSQTVTHSGDLTNNGTLSGASNANFIFNGTNKTVTNNGSITPGLFVFDQAGAKTLTGTGSFSGLSGVRVNNGAAVTLISSHQLNVLAVAVLGGGTMDITNQALSLSGSGTPLTVNAGGMLTTTGSTIVYQGAAAQTIATTNVNYNSLAIDNAAGVTLSAAKTIPGTLVLMNGTFSTGGNLTMGHLALISRSGGSLSVAPTLTGPNPSINLEYTGISPITTGVELPVSATSLNTLTMLNSDIVSLALDPTVNGSLALNNGSLSIGAHTLTINGPLTSSGGTLTGGLSSNLVFGGSGAATLPGVTLNNLTLNRAGGILFGGDVTVNGMLTLTSGDVNTGSNTLTMPATATSSGTTDVVGNVKRTGFVINGTALSFGNPLNTIKINTGTMTAPTDINILIARNAPTTYIAAVQRSYTITPTGGSGINATVRLHYRQAELNGNDDTSVANFNFRRFTGGGWKAVLATSRNTGVVEDNWLENNAVTTFSEWTFANLAPTASNGVVSGRIVDDVGNPVEGALVPLNGTQNRKTISDRTGNYTFTEVETNGFYTIAPSRVNYTFNPAQRSFSLLGAHTEASFTATANGGHQNPLDTTEYFVRQHYLDFLLREPDEAGFNFWVNNISSCGSDAGCLEVKRINASAAFFLSIEFQQTGFLVHRMYKTAYGDIPGTPVPVRFSEFIPDTSEIGRNGMVNQSDWQETLEHNKQAFADAFVARTRFTQRYGSMNDAQFVDTLNQNAGLVLTPVERDQVVRDLLSSAKTRAQVLRSVAENPALVQQEFNRAFVLMQYFGYLRRDPNTGPDTDFTGYNFWLNKLNTFGGNFEQAEMVKAFLNSGEYRGRFLR